MKEIRFMVPVSWWTELHAGARARQMSISDLMRQFVRNFMLGRYDDDERKSLEARA